MTLSTQEKLEKIKSSPEITPDKPETPILQRFLLQQIPFVNILLKTADKVGVSTNGLVNLFISTTRAAKSLRGLQAVGVALSGLDLVMLPFAYIACRVAGQPFPFTLSRGLKTLAAGAAFTLGVLALAFPAIAPIVIVTGVVSTIGTGIGTIVKQWLTSRQLAKQLTPVEKEIGRLKTELDGIKKTAGSLEPIQDANQEKIARLYDDHQKLLESLSDKINQKADIERKLQALGVRSYINNSVGLGLSIAGAVGIGMAVIAPPVGLFILTLSAVTGLAFVSVSAVTLFLKRKSSISNKSVASSDSQEIKRTIQPLEEKTPVSGEQYSASSQALSQEAAATVDTKAKVEQDVLSHPGLTIKSPGQLHFENELQNRAEITIGTIKEKHNLSLYAPLVVQFLANVSRVIKAGDYKPEEILSTLKELGLDHISEKICKVLDSIQAKNTEISTADYDLITSLVPVKRYLDEHPAQPRLESSSQAKRLVELFEEHYQPSLS